MSPHWRPVRRAGAAQARQWHRGPRPAAVEHTMQRDESGVKPQVCCRCPASERRCDTFRRVAPTTALQVDQVIPRVPWRQRGAVTADAFGLPLAGEPGLVPPAIQVMQHDPATPVRSVLSLNTDETDSDAVNWIQVLGSAAHLKGSPLLPSAAPRVPARYRSGGRVCCRAQRTVAIHQATISWQLLAPRSD